MVCLMNDEILTVSQAATYLQVSDKTVLKWIKNGIFVKYYSAHDNYPIIIDFNDGKIVCP